MPRKFDAEFTQIKAKVREMGRLAQEMLDTAMKALVDRDEALVAKVNELEDEVDRHQIEIDDGVVRLLATHSPVALDLRSLLMVTRINTELERVGDQACNMCEYVQLLLSEPELKALTDLPRMAKIAGEMIESSLDAFENGSSEAAVKVIERDDEVDALNDRIFRELLTDMVADAKTIQRSVALVLTARSLERVADHATNISEEVVYLVRGEDIRHGDPTKPGGTTD